VQSAGASRTKGTRAVFLDAIADLKIASLKHKNQLAHTAFVLLYFREINSIKALNTNGF